MEKQEKEKQKGRIFISYARDDDEPFVKLLYNDLIEEGYIVWWDRQSMPSRALEFGQEIAKAILSHDRLILVVGPDAIKSGYVQAEVKYAFDNCKVVTTIRRIGGLANVPDAWKKSHVLDFRKRRSYNKAKTELLRILAEEIKPLGQPISVPPMPEPFSPRLDDLESARKIILPGLRSLDKGHPPVKVVSIWGMGGTGKSVLAAALARNCETRRAFYDGIYWVKFPTPLHKRRSKDIEVLVAKGMRTIGISLGDKRKNYKDQGTAEISLGKQLDGKTVLIVLDNIWHQTIVDSFEKNLSVACRLLVTTRLEKIAVGRSAYAYELTVLTGKAANQFLADWAYPRKCSEAEKKAICSECGNLPFALALCGAAAMRGTPWSDILDALRTADLTYLKGSLPHYSDYSNLFNCLEMSCMFLEKDKDSKHCMKPYLDMAVFQAGEPVPQSVVMALWSRTTDLSERAMRDVLTELSSRALLHLDGNHPLWRISLHDLQRDHIRTKVGNFPALHRELGEVLLEWWQKHKSKKTKHEVEKQKKRYVVDYLLFHLVEAQHWKGVETLLTDVKYLRQRQEPSEQFSFQREFVALLCNSKFPLDILSKLHKALKKLRDGKTKADWLDTFAYWINEFGVKSKTKKLKDIARQFDSTCGKLSHKLSESYRKKGDHDWAMRFAELETWVYERAEYFKQCERACRDAQRMCSRKGMPQAYREIGRAEFIRLQTHALTTLATRSTSKNQIAQYKADARAGYQELVRTFPRTAAKKRWPTVKKWEELEANLQSKSDEVLTTPSQSQPGRYKAFKAKIISNIHDSISAIHIIRFFEKHYGLVEWIHSKRFKVGDFASKDTLFTVMIGGPKAPGCSKVANRFYEADKERYLRMYSGLYFEAGRLETTVTSKGKKIHCYMLGGISKVNTLMASYEFTTDPDVMKIIKKHGKS